MIFYIRIQSFVICLFFFIFFLQGNSVFALCVKGDKANLRRGPSTKTQKLWQVFTYMPLQKTGEKNNWYRVKDLDGDTYWVHKELVTSAFKCAVVKEEKANFRKGPGTQYPKVSWSPMPKYFSMKVLKITSKWVKIMDETGDVAWVYRPLVWIN